jgi:hypothetical protein
LETREHPEWKNETGQIQTIARREHSASATAKIFRSLQNDNPFCDPPPTLSETMLLVRGSTRRWMIPSNTSDYSSSPHSPPHLSSHAVNSFDAFLLALPRVRSGLGNSESGCTSFMMVGVLTSLGPLMEVTTEASD